MAPPMARAADGGARSGWAIAAILSVGLVAGFVLVGERNAALERIAAALEELAQRPSAAPDWSELTELLEDAPHRTSPSAALSPAERVPAGPEQVPPDVDSLAAALRGQTELLRDLKSSSPATVAPAWSSVPPIDQLRLPTDSASVRADLLFQVQQEDAESRLTERHLLWSMPRVLETYGSPDDTYVTDNGPQWVYVLEAGDRKRYVRFNFDDGIVIAVED